jgi:hypothetical protein
LLIRHEKDYKKFAGEKKVATLTPQHIT